jgi:hypothetical protein
MATSLLDMKSVTTPQEACKHSRLVKIVHQVPMLLETKMSSTNSKLNIQLCKKLKLINNMVEIKPPKNGKELHSMTTLYQRLSLQSNPTTTLSTVRLLTMELYKQTMEDVLWFSLENDLLSLLMVNSLPRIHLNLEI